MIHTRRQLTKGLLLSLLMMGAVSVSAQESLRVISGDANQQWLRYTDARNSLYHHLTRQAFDFLSKRTQEVESLHSAESWRGYQQKIKANLHKAIGPFPEKTPLNPRVLGKVNKGSFRIEHIVFESQPGFFVTSSLFLPGEVKGRRKAPAIIYCSGHTPLGYRSETYQHTILNLVRKGFIVFAVDPVGQGERLQYFDPDTGKSTVGGSTAEHSYPGSQAFITGSSQARHMIWDGIRAVDYLLSRKEVDVNRIGITGRSGGGTQSAYIAAFDERIKAVAPECYITSFKRLLESIGPQDAEQNLPGGLSLGIDHGDLLMVRAPKPALMITTTGDFFSIQGARETAVEVSRMYKAFNAGDNFGMCEDDAGHAPTTKNREALYEFFQKHLVNPGDPTDEPVELLSPEELRVTPTGQVSAMKSETIFTLNLQEAQEILKAVEIRRSDLNTHLSAVKEKAIQRSGYRKPEMQPSPVFTGRVVREGYSIEKYFIEGEGDYVIPYLRFVPEKTKGTTLLYLHPESKSAHAEIGGELEKLVRNGFEVIAPDLPGVGENGNGDFHGDAYMGGVSHNIWYSSILISRSVVGIHAADISRLVDVAQKNGARNIYGVGIREMSPAMLYATAFDTRVKAVALLEPLASYRSLVSSREYHSPFIMGAVAGQLQDYDLPDLAGSLAPRPLALIRPLDGNAKAGSTDTQADLDIIRKSYDFNDATDSLLVVEEEKGIADHLISLWKEE